LGYDYAVIQPIEYEITSFGEKENNRREYLKMHEPQSRPYGRLEDSTVDKSGRVKRVWTVWLLVKWELLFKPFQPS
jgi:hypothetical protein